MSRARRDVWMWSWDEHGQTPKAVLLLYILLKTAGKSSYISIIFFLVIFNHFYFLNSTFLHPLPPYRVLDVCQGVRERDQLMQSVQWAQETGTNVLFNYSSRHFTHSDMQTCQFTPKHTCSDGIWQCTLTQGLYLSAIVRCFLNVSVFFCYFNLLLITLITSYLEDSILLQRLTSAFLNKLGFHFQEVKEKHCMLLWNLFFSMITFTQVWMLDPFYNVALCTWQVCCRWMFPCWAQLCPEHEAALPHP